MISVYPPAESVFVIELEEGDAVLSSVLDQDMMWEVVVRKADGSIQRVRTVAPRWYSEY